MKDGRPVWTSERSLGLLRVGSDADLVLVDLKKKQKIDKSMLFSTAGWSVFEGWEVTG